MPLPLDQHHQRILAQIRFPQGLAHQRAVRVNENFAQFNAVLPGVLLGTNNQRVALFQAGVAFGHNGLALPQDGRDQSAGKHGDIPNRLPPPGVLRVHVHPDEAYAGLLRIVVEGAQHVAVPVDHTGSPRHLRQQSTLNQDAQQHHAEHDLKDALIPVGGGDGGHDGKHNRGRAPQPRPGHHQHLIQRRAEGPQQQKHRRRAGNQGHEQRDAHRGQQCRRQPGGEHQQTQQKEDQDLHHVVEHVKKGSQILFPGDVLVAQQDTGQIGAQVSVAAQQGGQGVGDQGRRNQENAVQTTGQRPAAKHIPRRPGHRHPDGHPPYHLFQQHHRYLAGAGGAAQHGQQGHGEHVGTGVVAAAFDLQQGSGVVFQVQPLAAQHREYRRRVGGTQYRPHQQALRQAHAQHKPAEQPGQPGGDHHPQGAQQHRLAGHRPGGAPFGAEAAVKHNEDQRGGTHLLGQVVVFKVDFQQSVGAEQHTQCDKEKQGRDAQPAGQLAAQDAGQQHHRAEKQKQIHETALLSG